jgi:DNA-binding MarR family transcriptional regulator
MQDNDEELAVRFIRVLETLKEVGRYRMPSEVKQQMGQLSFNQIHMLRLLHHEPGLAQKDLAEHLHITPAAVSTAIRDMEKLGLVERQPDPADARQVCVHLSKRSQEFTDCARENHHKRIAHLLNALPREEQAMVVSALERALAVIETDSEFETYN